MHRSRAGRRWRSSQWTIFCGCLVLVSWLGLGLLDQLWLVEMIRSDLYAVLLKMGLSLWTIMLVLFVIAFDRTVREGGRVKLDRHGRLATGRKVVLVRMLCLVIPYLLIFFFLHPLTELEGRVFAMMACLGVGGLSYVVGQQFSESGAKLLVAGFLAGTLGLYVGWFWHGETLGTVLVFMVPLFPWAVGLKCLVNSVAGD